MDDDQDNNQQQQQQQQQNQAGAAGNNNNQQQQQQQQNQAGAAGNNNQVPPPRQWDENSQNFLEVLNGFNSFSESGHLKILIDSETFKQFVKDNKLVKNQILFSIWRPQPGDLDISTMLKVVEPPQEDGQVKLQIMALGPRDDNPTIHPCDAHKFLVLQAPVLSSMQGFQRELSSHNTARRVRSTSPTRERQQRDPRKNPNYDKQREEVLGGIFIFPKNLPKLLHFIDFKDGVPLEADGRQALPLITKNRANTFSENSYNQQAYESHAVLQEPQMWRYLPSNDRDFMRSFSAQFNHLKVDWVADTKRFESDQWLSDIRDFFLQIHRMETYCTTEEAWCQAIAVLKPQIAPRISKLIALNASIGGSQTTTGPEAKRLKSNIFNRTYFDLMDSAKMGSEATASANKVTQEENARMPRLYQSSYSSASSYYIYIFTW